MQKPEEFARENIDKLLIERSRILPKPQYDQSVAGLWDRDS